MDEHVAFAGWSDCDSLAVAFMGWAYILVLEAFTVPLRGAGSTRAALRGRMHSTHPSGGTGSTDTPGGGKMSGGYD